MTNPHETGALAFIVIAVLAAFAMLNVCLWGTECGYGMNPDGSVTNVSPISKIIPWKLYP